MLRSRYRRDHNRERRPMISGRLFADGVYGPIMDLIVDTGSVPTLFPLGLLVDLNLAEADLTWTNDRGIPMAVVWGGASYPRGTIELGLQLLDDHGGQLAWLGKISFSNAPLPFAILGQEGGLEHLAATFDGYAKRLTLTDAHPLPLAPWPAP